MKNWFLTTSAATDFGPASIAQLIQIELLPRRQSLAKIQGVFLSNSQFFMLFVYIPKVIQKLVFGCVGYATNLLLSLATCACTMVARSKQKICAAALPNSQLLNHFRYNKIRKHTLKKLLFFFLIGNPWFLSAEETTTPPTIEPWFTGPLIAPIGEVYPLGHYLIQPFFEFNTITGTYDKHWHAHSTPHFFNFSTAVEVIIGITKRMDIQINPVVLYNHTRNQASWGFGDFPLTLDIQLLPRDEYKYFPGIMLVLTESFPTGKYQKLNPHKLATDVSGNGSFATSAGLVFYKIYHLSGFHFLSMIADFAYTYYAPVHVRGLNFYGGGPGCAGKVYPGNSFTAIVSFEFSLNRNWVIALDNVYTHFDKNRFKGNPGHGTVPSVPAVVTKPSSEILSFAPAIEYNFNANWGIIAGSWFSATGRNNVVFRNAIISFIYQY